MFLCKKLYQHQFVKEDLPPEIQEQYRSDPLANPPDENGQWHPHWMFIGEITEVRDTRTEEDDQAPDDVRDMFAGIDFSAPDQRPPMPE